jgi:2'-hydroxyisoflavone reductase
MVEACAAGTVGTFNATSEPVSLGEVLAACGHADITWVDEQFLLDQGVGHWMELPLWVRLEDSGFLQMSVAKAVAAGLSFRPLEETTRDTLDWARETGAQLVTETPWGAAGLDPAREAQLLEAWATRS